MVPVLLVLGGLVALLFGAEALLRSAVSLARRLSVPPMVVGLTVVSVGTSVPELAVGIDAAQRGSAGIAVGNIVGTNLVNLLLILGMSALIAPIALDRMTLRRDLPAMALAAVALYLLARDGDLDMRDGVLLCGVAVAYTAIVLLHAWRQSATARAARRKRTAAEAAQAAQASRPIVVDLLLLALGLVAVTVGADLLVDGSVQIARSLDVSETVIGLTVVAIGTSAPELVTALVSTVRGNRDVALGNLIGSSVYNIGLVLGATTLLAPAPLDVGAEALDADLLLMLTVALACVPVFWSGRRISRVEGGIAVGLYLAYVVWLTISHLG